jgi:copper chaperone CopZ
MHCQSCVTRLEKALKRVADIEAVRVDLAAETVTVQGDVLVHELHQTIADAGFSVRKS